MKRNLTIVFLILVVLLSTLFMGCMRGDKTQNANNQSQVTAGQDEENNQEEGIADKDQEDEEDEEDDSEIILGEDDFNFKEFESVISEEETIYTLIKEDGENVYLEETSPEVIALSLAVAKYGEAMYEIDWETATDATGKIKELQTPETQKKDEETGYYQQLVELYREHKAKSKFLGVHVINHMIFEGEYAEADVDYAYVYENVENLASYETGTIYYAPMRVVFQLVDDKWLVVGAESRTHYYIEEE